MGLLTKHRSNAPKPPPEPKPIEMTPNEAWALLEYLRDGPTRGVEMWRVEQAFVVALLDLRDRR